MEKKRSASSVRGKRLKESEKHIMDPEIDFSDIPESTASELKRAVRVGRPSTGNAKQLIAIRISPALLSRVRKLADVSHKPYQTLLHELIEDAVDRKAA
jgi:predicted DNA binding CopG/RHH family protein